MRNVVLILSVIFIVSVSCTKKPKTVTITPQEYLKPIRNPHKGFEIRPWRGPREESDIKILCTVTRARNGWRDWEVKESDDVEVIRERFEAMFEHLKPWNHAVVIRISIDPKGHFPDLTRKNGSFPDDLSMEDYLKQTPYFRQRCVNLIQKVAEIIDGDPRVDRFELGFVGKWGESHDPDPTDETQMVIGKACEQYFHTTPIAYRNQNQYVSFSNFGLYNDALLAGGCGIAMEKYINNSTLKDRWKKYPMSGEIPYGLPCSYPRLLTLDKIAQHDSLVNWLVNVTRYSHVNSLMNVFYTDSCWLLTDHALENFYTMHKSIGYRYVIEEFSYPNNISPGDSFTIGFKVKNTGSSLVYYNYPVVIGLLDVQTNDPVWISEFTQVDIRNWVGGEGFPVEPTACHANFKEKLYEYTTPAPVYNITQSFELPDSLADGTYYIALAILDYSAKKRPAIRFAVKNYFKGGWHPMGYIGINHIPEQTAIDSTMFDDVLGDLLLNDSK